MKVAGTGARRIEQNEAAHGGGGIGRACREEAGGFESDDAAVTEA